jgi:hypothetical protein
MSGGGGRRDGVLSWWMGLSEKLEELFLSVINRSKTK